MFSSLKKPVAICDGLFYFAHDLSRDGDSHVTVAGGGAGPRCVSGLKNSIKSVVWMDSGREIAFAQNEANGLATLNLTGTPYGSNLVVRVAKIEV